MEFKSSIILESIRGERRYEMVIPNEAPLGEIYEVCSGILTVIADKIKEHSESVAPKEAEEGELIEEVEKPEEAPQEKV